MLTTKFTHFIKKNVYEYAVRLEFQDMDTAEGLAEGSYYDVLKIPTSIIEKEDRVIARWEGEVPKTEEFKEYMPSGPVLAGGDPRGI